MDKRFEEAVSARDEFSEPLAKLRDAYERGPVEDRRVLEEAIQLILLFRSMPAVNYARKIRKDLLREMLMAQQRMVYAFAAKKDNPWRAWIIDAAVRKWRRQVINIINKYDDVC